MKRLIFEDIYSWSVFSPERQIDLTDICGCIQTEIF